MHRATGAVFLTPWFLIRLVETHVTLGQPIEALKCLAEAAQIIEATDDRLCEAELYWLRGDLLNATGDRAAAEQSYHQSIAVAQRQSAKLFELRAAPALHASGVIRASAERLAISSRQSTVGSPKASTRRSSKM
jgi:hypothetical protein